VWLADFIGQGSHARVLHLAIGARTIEAGLFDGFRFESTWRVDLAGSDDAFADLPVVLSNILAHLGTNSRTPGRPVPCQVVVSDFWLRAIELPWSAQLTGSAAQVLTYVRMQFEASGWNVAGGDRIRWDEGRALRPYLGVLYPALLLEAINDATTAHELVLTSIRPYSVLALELAEAMQPTALAVLEDDICTFAPVSTRKLGEPTIEVTSQPHVAAVAAWHRSALLVNATSGAPSLAILDLSYEQADAQYGSGGKLIEIPPMTDVEGLRVTPTLAATVGRTTERCDSLDAIQAQPRRGLIHAATALALLSVIVLGLQLHQSTSQLAALRNAGLSPAPPPTPMSTPLTKAEMSEWQRVNEIMREINAPVGVVMASLKAPSDIDVQVVSAEVDAALIGKSERARLITVQAESHQPLDMQRYVDYLESRPALASASLVHHDLTEGSAGALYRFTVEATWRP
jgi:hypothetical protein